MKTLITIFTLALSANSFAAASVTCGGNEPSWGVTTSQDRLIYSEASGAKPLSLKILNTKQAQGFSPDVAFVIKTKYTGLTVIAGDCSDGMSDINYTHHGVMNIDGKVLYGCCSLK